MEWRLKMIEKEYEILVEGPSKTNPALLSGRTRGNELVVFDGNPGLIGQLVIVKITDSNSWTLFGTLI